MKKFRQYITLSMILACVSTSLQSCLFEEKDYFDQPAAIRLTEDVNHYQKILQDAPNGWVLEYNIGEDNPMGVIPVLCRFEAGKVKVCQKAHLLFLCTKPRLSQAEALLLPKDFVSLSIITIIIL